MKAVVHRSPDTEVPDVLAPHGESGRDWRAGAAPREPGAPDGL